MSSVRWERTPELSDPVMVAAFGGWNDAADAASDAVAWLGRCFGASTFAELDPEGFYDFQAARPQVMLRHGVMKGLTWPTTSFAAATAEASGRDLVLVTGPEPNMAWKDFCDTILDVASQVGASMLVTLGALLAEAPHTRPVRITGVASEPGLAARVHLHPSHYEGPTGVTGVLHHRATEADLVAASLWAPVPHYVAAPPNPRCTLALLEAFGAATDLPLDTENLHEEAEGWQRRVEVAAGSDADIENYVRNLEATYDAEDDRGPIESGALDSEGDLPSGDALAAEFQKYLRGEHD
ncbi:MAG: PAC2 family protein [Acidimicrobiia bacterium]|nr:PAC2 family protein [Acidimicrobiia bacterium]